MRVKSTYTRGFTLIELITVITIIGALVTVVFSTINAARDEALITQAKIELDSINDALGVLYSDTGRYANGARSLCRSVVPGNNEVDLSAATAGLTANGSSWNGWNGPYVSNVEDPWGSPYYLDEDYQCLASTTGCGGVADSGNDSSVLVSCGPNGSITNDSCTYDGDNVVLRLCGPD